MATPDSNPFDEATQARRRLMLAAAIAGALVLAIWVGGIGSGLDLALQGQWLNIRGPRDPSPQVVVIAIDEKSLASLGPMPWPRKQYAPLIEKLKALGARVIAFDFTFGPNPRESEPGAPVPAAEGGAMVPGPSHNDVLSAAMASAGNVVFGLEFDHLRDPSPPGAQPPDFVLANAVPRFDPGSMTVVTSPTMVAPEPMLGAAATALGFVNALPEGDNNIHRYPMLIKHGDRYYPSLSLQIARVYMQEPMDAVKVLPGTVTVGFADIPIGSDGQMWLDWTSKDPAFPRFSVTEVLRGEVRAEDINDKAVIVAGWAKGLDDRNLPWVKSAPGVLLHATVLDNIFKIQFLHYPSWSWLLKLTLVPLLLVMAVLLYPRLGTAKLLAIGPGVALVLLLLSLALFLVKGVRFEAFYPALAAFLPVLPVVALRLRHSEAVTRDVTAEKLESDKLLGLSFQEKGMLDMALATFNKLPLTSDIKSIYLNLGVDFDNRGQKEKAFLAYKRVFDADPRFEDVAARMESLRAQGVGTRLFATGTMELPGSAPTVTSAAATAMPGPTRIDSPDATRALGTRGPGPTMAGPTIAGGTSTPTTAGTAGASTGPGATVAPAGRTRAGVGGEDSTVAVGARSGSGMVRQFGRYEILEKLGRGAMGDVFKVRDPKIGRIAAMKTIRVDIELTPQQMIELRQRFYREAQAAGKLTHPNIVTIYDVGEEEGVSFIVMEFVEGQTLTGLVKKVKLLNPAQIKHVIVNAAVGLDYAHQNGVYHRDVKPDNIMVSKTGVVKVMDFGIAHTVESDMTKTGSVLGTPAYMSPEQFSGKKVDARADIFSLGVVFYELVAHKRPFRGDTPTAIMFEILQKDPPPPSVADPTASPAWDPVVMKALKKNPEERFATAMEFANAVRAVAVK